MASPTRKRNHARRCPLAFAAKSLVLTLAATLGGVGCSSKEGEPQDTDTSGTNPNGHNGGTNQQSPNQECQDNPAFFRDQVWSSILQSNCRNCHNAGGAAKDSKLVLVGSEWGPTYLDQNMKITEEVARNQRDGKSLLLLKPVGDASHGGGAVLDKDSAELKTLEEFIKRIDNPVTCGNNGSNDTSAYKGLEMISASAALRKASLNLAGRLPTKEELALVEKDESKGLDQALDLVMEDEAFYKRLIVLFNDYFLTDLYLRNSDALALIDTDDYPDSGWFNEVDDEAAQRLLRRESNRAVARELLELVVFIVKNHRSFEEILTADYTVMNPYSARIYGAKGDFLDPLDPNEYRPVRIPGVPHAGVLTSSMFMNRFPTTETNRNRHRSKMIFRFFLATDLEALASRPLDPTQIADHNPTLNSPSCTVCHSTMDPLAGALQNWDAQGRYRPRESGWYPDMVPPGFGDLRMPPEESKRAASWLAKQIVKDKRFALSIVHMVHKMLTGHDALKEPGDATAADYAARLKAFELQSSEFAAIAEQFAAKGFELREVFKAIIRSPDYRVASDTPMTPEQSQTFAKLGTARLLTPEQLNAKITATLGYPWRYRARDTDLLLSTQWYSIFYGGIDSDGVVQRITDLNGIMANIVQRMANEMSCWSVARDFVLEKDKRLLFPHVQRSFVPKDENGFTVPAAEEAIKKNLVHLHKHLLGVELGTNDPEIERSYKLFVDVWSDGNKKVKNKEYPRDLTYTCRSQRDFWTNKEHPKDRQVYSDADYTVRSWIAVMNYLLTDYRFLHE